MKSPQNKICRHETFDGKYRCDRPVAHGSVHKTGARYWISTAAGYIILVDSIFTDK